MRNLLIFTILSFMTEKIRIETKKTWENKDRFSLKDTDSKLFTVVIEKLHYSDEGYYYCDVDTPDIPSTCCRTKVELEVKEGEENYFNSLIPCVMRIASHGDDCCRRSFTETAYLGGNATISYKYPNDHKDSIKYFCKQDGHFTCKYNIDLQSGKESNKQGSFLCLTRESLHCDNHQPDWGGYRDILTTAVTTTTVTTTTVTTTTVTTAVTTGVTTTLNTMSPASSSIVKFHKNSGSPNETTAAIANEGTSSTDCATVSFGRSPPTLFTLTNE
ncbi:unnamed protein product [Coregonus sp. 'balchen']|nr:unnamed protein product [Coregonus sp. 'balchen']